MSSFLSSFPLWFPGHSNRASHCQWVFHDSRFDSDFLGTSWWSFKIPCVCVNLDDLSGKFLSIVLFSLICAKIRLFILDLECVYQCWSPIKFDELHNSWVSRWIVQLRIDHVSSGKHHIGNISKGEIQPQSACVESDQYFACEHRVCQDQVRGSWWPRIYLPAHWSKVWF